MKILIVDDSSMIRQTISKIVITTGFKPLLAENGAEAIARLRKHENDIALIIMDWNMPILDGYDTLVKIRANDQYKNIPVLMATSEGVQEEVIKAIKAGANGYLVKPFKPEELAIKINEILNF